MKILLICLATLALPAAAQPTVRLATKDEYRACRQDQAALAQRQQRLDARSQQLQADAAQLQRENAALNAAWQKVGLKSPKDLRAYNLGTDALNVRVKALNASTTVLTQDTQAYNADVLAVNGRCGGIAVAAEDAAEVDAEFPPPAR